MRREDLPRPLDPGRVRRLVAAARRPVLLLDYDGTLAPFRVERDRAIPWPGVRERLAAILAAGGRVAVVTGRDPADLPPLLAIDPLPEIVGNHGLGDEPLPRDVAERLAEAARRARERFPAERVEVKPAGVAIHWRGEPAPPEAEARALFAPLAGDGLDLLPFDGGLELRAALARKDRAVRRLARDADLVAYLGDDRTDEDAFRAVPPGGFAVLVAPSPRPTAAPWHLVPPAGLLEFLDAWRAGLA